MCAVSKHILSISYNEPLLRTREMLLVREGYLVTSALGFTESVEHCRNGRFDLFILGHSIPDKDKRELISIFRRNCKAPVLALGRQGEDLPDGADEHADPQEIKALLERVAMMLNNRKASSV